MKTQMHYNVLGGMLLAATALTACSDEDFGVKHTARPGDAVYFSAAQRGVKNRTAYDDQNIFQINWQTGDKVRIYAEKDYNNLTDAVYTVTPVTSADGMLNSVTGQPMYPGNEIAAQGTLTADGEPLQWKDETAHKFFSVYPETLTGCQIDWTKGQFFYPVIRFQTCDLQPADKSGPYKAYDYYGVPNLTSCPLIAYTETVPHPTQPVNEVFLDYKPAVTTVEVVIPGPTGADKTITVTGMSVERHVPNYEDENYDFQGWNGPTADHIDLTQGTPTGTTRTEITFVNLRTPDGKNSVTLSEGEKLLLTAFLRPYEVDNDHSMQVRVHATGAVNIITEEIGDDPDEHIDHCSKRRITIDPLPLREGTKAWMTPLDDDILVSQLSIPGTYHSGTGNILPGKQGWGNISKTQAIPLRDQIAMGVRAFDVEACYTVEADGQKPNCFMLRRGTVFIPKSLREFVDDMKKCLDETPGELFVLKIGDAYSGQGNDKLQDRWSEIGDTLMSYMGEDYYCRFKKDLTLADARHRIIVLTEDDFQKRAQLGFGLLANYQVGAQGEATITGDDVAKVIYDNDCVKSDAAARIPQIKALMDKSAAFHLNASTDKNTWVINNAWGQPKSDLAVQMAEYAAVINPAIHAYMDDAAKPVGSLGIFYMNFVGSDDTKLLEGDSQTYKVYGALLPQAVVDNNYKYRLLRHADVYGK